MLSSAHRAVHQQGQLHLWWHFVCHNPYLSPNRNTLPSQGLCVTTTGKVLPAGLSVQRLLRWARSARARGRRTATTRRASARRQRNGHVPLVGFCLRAVDLEVVGCHAYVPPLAAKSAVALHSLLLSRLLHQAGLRHGLQGMWLMHATVVGCLTQKYNPAKQSVPGPCTAGEDPFLQGST